MRKKILFVITKSNFGGAQRYVYDLATHLPSSDYEVVVALGGTGRKGDAPGLLKDRLEEAGIRVYTVEHFLRDISLFSEIRALFELITLFKREKPDVIHLNSSKALGLGALAGRIAHIPRIIGTIHGLPFYEKKRGMLFIAIAYLGSLASCVLAHRIVLVSQHDYSRWGMPFFLKKKLRVVHNGIETTSVKPKHAARKHIIPKLDPETVIIGSVAELTGNKNIATAIDACALLRDRGLDFHYVVMGSGEEQEKLEELIADKKLAGRVTLCGFVQHAQEYISAYDIFLMPSYKEGLPYVLLEAGNASLPVVASNVGGIPEIIEHEKTGLLVDPFDAKNVANALQTLLEDQKQASTYGTALNVYVSEHFSLKRMLHETNLLY